MILCILRRHTPSACVHIRLFDLLSVLSVFGPLHLVAFRLQFAMVRLCVCVCVKRQALKYPTIHYTFRNSSFTFTEARVQHVLNHDSSHFYFVSITKNFSFICANFCDRMLIDGAFSRKHGKTQTMFVLKSLSLHRLHKMAKSVHWTGFSLKPLCTAYLSKELKAFTFEVEIFGRSKTIQASRLSCFG